MIKNLLGQLSLLSVVQVISTLIPLLIVPYIMAHVGPSGFGHYNQALLYSSIFIPILDMGFDLFASKEMTRNLDGAGRLWGMQLQQKLLFWPFALLLYAGIVFALGSFRAIWPMMFLALGYAIGASLMPNWYFEGNKRFLHVQLYALVWKLVYALGVIGFIRQPEHENWIMAFNSIGALLVLAYSWGRLLWEGVRPEWNPWSTVVQRLKGNATISVTPISTYLLSFLPSLIVGFLLGPVQFGYYSVVDRVMQAFRLPGTLLSTVVYVQYNRLLSESHALFLKYRRNVSALVFSGGILLTVLLLVLEQPIMGLLSAGQSSRSAHLAYGILVWSGVFIIQRQHLQKLLLALEAQKTSARISIGLLLLMPVLFSLAHSVGGQRALFGSMLLFEASFVLLLSIYAQRSLRCRAPVS